MYAQTLAVLGLMILAFVVAVRLKADSTLSLLSATAAGAIWSIFQDGPVEVIAQFVEGGFFLFNIAMVVFCATFFVMVLRRNGALDAIVSDITRVFQRRPALLLIAMTLVVIFPGALTGSGTAAVMATGGLVGPVLVSLGIPIESVAAIVAFAGTMGMIAPPVNIPAMIIAEGVVMPYTGFTWPLLLLTIPPAIAASLIIGLPWVRKRKGLAESIISEVDRKAQGARSYLGVAVVVTLMVLTRLFPYSLPVLGLPLIFAIGAFAALAAGLNGRGLLMELLGCFNDTVRETLQVIGILIAAGALLQIMSLTGVRGLIVVTTITLPPMWLYVMMSTMYPLVGGVLTSFGAATVIGVPLVLSFLGRNSILVASAVSAVGGLGVLVPPTSIVGAFAACAVGYQGPYWSVLRKCIIPWAIVTALSVLMVVYSKRLLFLV
ncbi:MAG: TRAP transporter large permease subunit [Firmicutes bacterium]|jgi:TRAP-type C4-dicarboxylate transport system permease large subunit|nr:TRAP transporter large permease subunit [Bacillota bacterium]